MIYAVLEKKNIVVKTINFLLFFYQPTKITWKTLKKVTFQAELFFLIQIAYVILVKGGFV